MTREPPKPLCPVVVDVLANFLVVSARVAEHRNGRRTDLDRRHDLSRVFGKRRYLRVDDQRCVWVALPVAVAKAVLQNNLATPFVAVQSFYANEGKNISPY
jgi:hypothetical protein